MKKNETWKEWNNETFFIDRFDYIPYDTSYIYIALQFNFKYQIVKIG